MQTFRFSSTAARKILQRLCSIPTVPFHEDLVADYVREFAGQRPRLNLERDRFGNLLLDLPAAAGRRSAGRNSPRWVFTAHMDHPGFVVDRMLDSRTVRAHFYGGVNAEYFKNSRVRFFQGRQELRATVLSIEAGADKRPIAAALRVARPLARGTPGMWDQGEGRFIGGKFLSRVCDDLAGAAAALAMLDLLARKPLPAHVAVLLTRAEEEGFIGAIAASKKPRLLRKSDRLIAIECSAVQPYAPQGGGVILRVGDRTSVFNSALTYYLNETAVNLAKRDKAFKFQRALMPGGTCEATVYDAYGFTAAAVCVALGNYHNMDRQKKKIAPEFVRIDDWENMVKLFLALAQNANAFVPGHSALRQKLEARFDRFKDLLEANAATL